LVNAPSADEARAELERLGSLDAETQLRFLGILEEALSQADCYQPQLDLDLGPFLDLDAVPVRRHALSLASHTSSERTRRHLLANRWRADQESDPFIAFYGSHLLTQDESLTSRDLAERITPELCLVLVKDSRDPDGRALERILAWAEHEAQYSGSRSFGTFVTLAEAYRDSAFDTVVAAAPERTMNLLAAFGDDPRTVLSMAFAPFDGPLAPLLRSAARAGLSGIVQFWRNVIALGEGFHRSSALEHLPAEMPDGEPFDTAREEMIARATSDDDYIEICAACEAAGRQAFLLAWIRSRWASEIGFDQARAITLAAFLEPTPEAQALWAEIKSPHGGWMSGIYGRAREEWLRSENCVVWRDRFGDADEEASAAGAYALWVATRDGRRLSAIGKQLAQRRWRRAWVNFDADRRDAIRKKHVDGFAKSIVFNNRCERDIHWPAI
jgi:hypothetical protein